MMNGVGKGAVALPAWQAAMKGGAGKGAAAGVAGKGAISPMAGVPAKAAGTGAGAAIAKAMGLVPGAAKAPLPLWQKQGWQGGSGAGASGAQAMSNGVSNQPPAVKDDGRPTPVTLHPPKHFIEPDEIPDHLVGAIAGSMRMKRHLEAVMQLEGGWKPEKKDSDADGASEPPAKRRRFLSTDGSSWSNWGSDLEGPADEPLSLEEQDKLEKIDMLLAAWGNAGHRALRFVLETLVLTSEIDELMCSTWKPRSTHDRESLAEQLKMKVLEMRLKTSGPSGPAKPISLFAKRMGWEKDSEMYASLGEFDFGELRHVFETYDGMGLVSAIAEEGKKAESDWAEQQGEPPLPKIPGELGYQRWLRMDLTDPHSDAVVFGDANLSFSKLLAQHRNNCGITGRVIATTFEAWEQLKERYVEIDQTVKELVDNFGEVWHGVDCTRIAVDPRFRGLERTCGSIYYNFPHAGAVKGFFDKHPFIHWRHNNLMALFFRALFYFAKPGAIVKVASNASASGCRALQIIEAAESSEFRHIETFPFAEWALSGYHRSFGDKRDAQQRPDMANYRSQNAQADMVYCFRFCPSGEELPGVPIQQPPPFSEFVRSVNSCKCTFTCEPEMRAHMDGPSLVHFSGSSGGHHQEMRGPAHVQQCMQLYKRFLSEASGAHVG